MYAFPHLLLSRQQEGRLNTDFGSADIILHVCTLTVLDFHSLWPCAKFCLFFNLLLSEELLYSSGTFVTIASSLKKKTTRRCDSVCAQFQLRGLPPHFSGGAGGDCEMLLGEETDFAAENCEP